MLAVQASEPVVGVASGAMWEASQQTHVSGGPPAWSGIQHHVASQSQVELMQHLGMQVEGLCPPVASPWSSAAHPPQHVYAQSGLHAHDAWGIANQQPRVSGPEPAVQAWGESEKAAAVHAPAASQPAWGNKAGAAHKLSLQVSVLAKTRRAAEI